MILLMAALSALSFFDPACADSASSLADSLRAEVSGKGGRDFPCDAAGGFDPIFAPSPSGQAPRIRSAWAGSETETLGSSARFRHKSESDAWASKLELRRDTLSQAQLGWRNESWRVSAGNVEDASMPMRPAWLPRRNLPRSWMPAMQPIPGLSASPARVGAHYGFRGGSVYALRAFGALRPSGSPQGESPWSLRHAAGGMESSLWGRPSWHLGETRVFRDGKDSVAEHWASLGLATPEKALSVDAAWSGTRDNPSGGYALGIQARQPLGRGQGEIIFRQRSPDWSSNWDPGWMAPETDSLSRQWGAGEFALRLRLPVSSASFLEGEGWQTWVSRGRTRRAGMRGRAWTRRRGLSLEIRGAHWQSLASDAVAEFRGSLAGRVRIGEKAKWEWDARREWGSRSLRSETELSLDWEWMRANWKPGIRLRTDAADSLRTSLFLGGRVRLAANWSLEARGTLDLRPAYRPPEWQAALHYQGGR
jgi:hypothetical protein